MASDLIKVLREIRGTGAPEAAYTDGIYYDIAEKPTDDDDVTPRLADGMYKSMQVMYGDAAILVPIIEDITTVAGIEAEVVTVATDIDNVNIVAADIDNVNTVAADITDINTVATISTDVTIVADNDANITIVADNIEDVNNFADVYQGAKASDPSLRNDGSALQAGDMYFNTTSDVIRVYNGSIWDNSVSSVNGTANRYDYVVNTAKDDYDGVSNTVFPCVYDVGYIDVYVEGIKQVPTIDFTATNGTDITITSSVPTGKDIAIIGYGIFSVADHYTKTEQDVTDDAQDTAIALKAPIASPTFTGTVSGITKSMVGLTDVDDTSDADKPVSTAGQTALDLKANIASPALTGTPTAPTAAPATDTTQIATTAFVIANGGDLGDDGTSLSTNGYMKLSNGFIIQWGYVVSSSDSTLSTTFPIAFPTAVLSITPMGGDNGNGLVGNNTALGSSRTTTGFNFRSGSVVDYIYYMAIGY